MAVYLPPSLVLSPFRSGPIIWGGPQKTCMQIDTSKFLQILPALSRGTYYAGPVTIYLTNPGSLRLTFYYYVEMPTYYVKILVNGNQVWQSPPASSSEVYMTIDLNNLPPESKIEIVAGVVGQPCLRDLKLYAKNTGWVRWDIPTTFYNATVNNTASTSTNADTRAPMPPPYRPMDNAVKRRAGWLIP